MVVRKLGYAIGRRLRKRRPSEKLNLGQFAWVDTTRKLPYKEARSFTERKD